MPGRKAKTDSPVGTARPVQPIGDEIRLGEFSRGKLVSFTVYQVPGEADDTPEYRVYDTDGPAGPRLVCHFTPDRETSPVWRGAWNGDDWCGWIEEQARDIIADPQPDVGS